MTKGIWMVLKEHLLFMNEDGVIQNLPEYIKINGFIIVNTSREMFLDRKIMSFKQMLQQLKTNLKNKNNGYSYKVLLDYIYENDSFNRRTDIFHVQKKEDGIKIRVEDSNLTYYAKNDEERIIIRSQKSPEWFKINKKRINEITLLEDDLKENFNVKEILYKIHCPNAEKIKMLQQVKIYYQHMSKFIDVYKFEPVNISYTQIKKFGALYDIYKKEIQLKKNGYYHYFHEFFHHIDETTLGKRSTDTYNQIDELLNEIANDTTISQYAARVKHMRKSNGELKRSGKYSKKADRYHYLVRDNEIFARLLMDYIFKQVNHLLDDNMQYKYFDYTEDEIEKYGPQLLELIRKISLEMNINHSS